MSNYLDALHAAFLQGDLHAIQTQLGNPQDFPNTPMDNCTGETCLEYAIYHSPLSLVRSLLELGANPNYKAADGFPALISAIDRQGEDRYAVLELLLEFGADIHQRGVNDYTPLHYAATRDDAAAVKLLLQHGADPTARTRIDDYATPLEEAERFGHEIGAAALRSFVPPTT